MHLKIYYNWCKNLTCIESVSRILFFINNLRYLFLGELTRCFIWFFIVVLFPKWKNTEFKYVLTFSVKKLSGNVPSSWYQHSIWKWDSEDLSTRRRRRHISMVDQSWQCPDCGRCYIYQRGLNLHRRFECGKEPMFKCPFCPKKCHQPGNLTVHIRNKHRKNM